MYLANAGALRPDLLPTVWGEVSIYGMVPAKWEAR